MPSTTRGSILISTANDIGEALVEKLGGVGYSPNEWKEKYNLCGIAPVDSAPALSVLADSAGTGDERGSILIATADAIGAILNKKYNVLRGFKPKEWASACRKMKALEEGSVASASIASFSDGADTVPLTSCVCSIDANLDGKTAVNAVHTRKNLVNSSLNEQGSINATTGANVNSDKRIRTAYIKINANTTYSISIGGSVNLFELYQYKTDGTLARAYIAINAQTYTFTSHADAVSIRFSMRYADNSVIQTSAIENLQLEQSSEPTTYEEYSAETKTADLGRAVYGGQADIIKGEGVGTYTKVKLSDLTWTQGTAGGREYYNAVISTAETTNTHDIVTNLTYSGMVTVANMSDKSIAKWQQSVRIYDTDISSVSQLLETYGNEYIAYPNRYTTDFTFEPVKIDSFPGVNNIWNDCGNTAVEYYQAPKAIANIAPSIAGKSAVNLYQGKKNLYNAPVSVNIPSGGGNVGLYDCYFKKGVTYTYSAVTSNQAAFVLVGLDKNGTEVLRTSSPLAYTGAHSLSFTPTEDIYKFRIYYNAETTITDIMVEVGSTASSFVPYQDPTTYTAELGETVYGGSVDFVSGEVVKKNSDPLTFNGSENWQTDTTRNGVFLLFSTMGTQNFGDGACNMFTTIKSGSGMNSLGICFGINNYAIYIPHLFDGGVSGVSDISSWKTYLQNNDCTIVYPLATPTESTIPGRVISPIEGVNNYWNDAGGDTEIQYFENEA